MSTASSAASPREVCCPICMQVSEWAIRDHVYQFGEGTKAPRLVDLRALDDVTRRDALQSGIVACTAPSPDGGPPHYFPALYGEYAEPLVVGLVGGARQGKTHLLTAMITAALAGLGIAGTTVTAMDHRRHQRFRDEHIRPLENGRVLPATVNAVVDYADILLVSGPGGTRPVTFFVMSGVMKAQ